MSLKGDMKAFVRKKCKEGWSVERTKKGHFRWLYAATGAVVISAATRRTIARSKNTMADIKRCERPSFVRYTR